MPESVLADHSYHAADVHQWTSDISTQCLKQLKGVANGNAGFKFIGKRFFYCFCSRVAGLNTGGRTQTHARVRIKNAAIPTPVNCTILQKRNAGFHTNSACFWDAERDGKERTSGSIRKQPIARRGQHSLARLRGIASLTRPCAQRK